MLKWVLPLVWMTAALPVQAALPTFAEVRARDRSSEILLLDRTGQVMDSYRLDPKVRKAPWVGLEEFSPLVRKILVEMEDRRFFEHEGVDWWALGKSAASLLRARARGAGAEAAGRARGASTITMQLVSLIDPERERRGRRSVGQKWAQVQAALELEKSWTKTQILEAYLNLVPLRGEWVGVHSVTHFLFGKRPAALDPAEAAIIVAMLPSPNQPWPGILDRACVFLRSAYSSEPDRAAEFCAAAKARVGMRATVESAVQDRPLEHFTRAYVEALPATERKGGIRQTTIDLALQEKIVADAREALAAISRKNVGEIAALVLDHRTGETLAYLGNLQSRSSAGHVDGVRARRQAGSTLKPFFYALALQNRKYDLTSELFDEPLQVQTPNGAYRPENYDHVFHGWVPFATALASSLNIPAIKVVQEVGLDESVALLPKLGFGGIQAAYLYGPSIALGSADVTLEELTRAYAGLARSALGEGAAAFAGKFPLGPEASRAILRILSDNGSRSMTFGLNSVLATPYFTAVKTGTSKDMRDNWCVGSSDRYTVGVWVGNFSGRPMNDVSGVTGAAPLWRKVMDRLHATSPSRMPPEVAAVKLPESRALAEAGAPVERAPGGPRIAYPHAGSVLAVDPGIPAERQKVLLKVTAPRAGYSWVLNGRALGAVTEPLLWAIERGKQGLEIRDSSGHAVDSIGFLVR